MYSVKRLTEKIQSKITGWEIGKPLFGDPRYHEHPLDKENFQKIPPGEDSRRICYVDGGNLSIFNSPSIVVHLTRVGYCIYDGNKKINTETRPYKTFYSIATSFKKNNDLYFQTELLPIDEAPEGLLPREKDLVFYSYDQTLKQGQTRASLYSIALAGRVFAEWSLSRYLIENKLESGDVLVRDGSLQTTITGEADYANEAYNAALEKDVSFTGLAKTSTLYTDSGLPLFSALSILAKRSRIQSPWVYYPIVDIQAPDHRARMYAVHLHPRSKHVFRYEVLKDQPPEQDLDIIRVLSGNARDIAFPGYPYGLIEADRISRVRHEEVESLKIQLFSQISGAGGWDDLEALLCSTNAHEVLDSI